MSAQNQHRTRTDAPAGNRAERRAQARGKHDRGPTPHGTGKVQDVRVAHAPDPRQFSAHRKG